VFLEGLDQLHLVVVLGAFEGKTQFLLVDVGFDAVLVYPR